MMRNKYSERAQAALLPHRREFLVRIAMLTAAAVVGLPAGRAEALSFADLTPKDATSGVKAALQKGADVAVELLGRQDGFWANEQVRISLPEWMAKAEKALRLIGRGQEIESLKLGMNRAAEQAVPQAKLLLINAVKSMSVQDAKAILTGGDNSVTRFFQEKTRTPLSEKFLPIVSGITSKSGLAQQYNRVVGQVEQTGLVKLKPEQRKVETHVTARALDGLYYMIGEEEKKIRQNPVGTGSEILKKVFGTLRR